jgi:hypothetical protein
MIPQYVKRNESLLYLAPIFLTLAACSGGTKPVLKQSPTPAPQVARKELSPTPTLEAAPKIGLIQDPKFHEDCGYSLQLPEDYKSHNEKYIFDADLEDSGRMNIDGRDVDLRLVDNDEPNRKLKVGENFSKTYAGGNLNVRIDYVVAEVCDPNDEGCEVTRYLATITIDRNGVKQKVKARGLGGC